MSNDPQDLKKQDQKHEDANTSPLDPTDDFADMIGDTSGLSGISNDANSNERPSHAAGQNPRDISDFRYKVNLGRDVQDGLDDIAVKHNPDLDGDDEGFVKSNMQPEQIGEQSVSGDMPAPESDDDTLANAHQVGLRLDEDSEHPKELNTAEDIDKAEEYKHTH